MNYALNGLNSVHTQVKNSPMINELANSQMPAGLICRTKDDTPNSLFIGLLVYLLC